MAEKSAVMRMTQWCLGLVLSLLSVTVYALSAGSTDPRNGCHIAARYCRARGAEENLPQDYPPPMFLGPLQAHCSITAMRKFRPDGIINPAVGPRLCDLMARFLGATPGEWRAVVMAQMRGGNFNDSAAGRQLLWQIKAALRHSFSNDAKRSRNK